MSAQDLAVISNVPTSVDRLANLQRLGNILAASGYFADAREMAQAAVKVMAGQELGLPPIASMMGINIIKGKVALGAHLIASRIRAHGYDFRFKRHDNTGCILEFLSKPNEKGNREVVGESSFTEEDAKMAGCFSDMYKKYPRNMYYSRAVSNGSKWFTPEIFGGAPVYTPEELGAEVDSEGNAVIRADHPYEPAIDTGGHKVGTKAASDYVGDQKLKQAQEQQKRTAPTKSAPVIERPQAAAQPVPDHPAPVPAATLPPEIEALWQRMGTKVSSICQEFEVLKRDIGELLGSDAPYYAVLAKYGWRHSNDVKSTEIGGVNRARLIARELFELMAAGKAELNGTVEENRDDWVPDFDDIVQGIQPNKESV
jgi:hypothetical protein